MANACAASDLVTNAACYKHACMGETDRMGLKIYLMALEADALNATNYAADVNNLQAAIKSFQPLAPDDISAAEVSVDRENAVTAGASVPATTQALMNASVKYRNMRFQSLALLFLRCAIGR